MMAGAVPLIPPALQAQLQQVHLAARWRDDARGQGLHPSHARGGSGEFVEYRPYQPGDDIRRIDWKLYARADRLHVRDAEHDGPLAVWAVIDCSASMAQADPGSAQVSKLGRARLLAACLFEVALRQGDRFGLVGVGAQGLQVTGLGMGRRHRDRCGLALRQLQAGGELPEARNLAGIGRHVAAGALAVVLGDGFDESLVEVVRQLAVTRRDVVSVNLLTAQECELPGDGLYRLVDPETGVERVIDMARARAGFMERFNAHRAQLSHALDGMGVRHVEHRLDALPLEPLLELFGQCARAEWPP